jgi:hypothetical protein
VRFEAEGLQGLIDRRLEQVSHRRAPVDEVLAVTEQYRKRHPGWNVRHFHAWYRRAGGSRSYSWVKKQLQAAGLVEKGRKQGGHRKKRERMPLPGMMIHQDGSRHEWVPGHLWDLIVTPGMGIQQQSNINAAWPCSSPDISPDRGMMAMQDASRFAHPAPSQ